MCPCSLSWQTRSLSLSPRACAHAVWVDKQELLQKLAFTWSLSLSLALSVCTCAYAVWVDKQKLLQKLAFRQDWGGHQMFQPLLITWRSPPKPVLSRPIRPRIVALNQILTYCCSSGVFGASDHVRWRLRVVVLSGRWKWWLDRNFDVESKRFLETFQTHNYNIDVPIVIMLIQLLILNQTSIFQFYVVWFWIPKRRVLERD